MKIIAVMNPSHPSSHPHCPGQQKDRFHVENDEKDGDHIKLYTEPLPGTSQRVHTGS